MSLDTIGEGGSFGWLTSVDAAAQALAEIERVDEAAVLVDRAETAKVYARNVLRSREAQNHAAHVSLLCQRRAGELLAEMPKAGNNRQADTLSGCLGVESEMKAQQLSSRWQRLAAIPEEQFTEAVETIKGEGDELTTAGLLRRLDGAHVGHNSGDSEWYSPCIVAAILEPESTSPASHSRSRRDPSPRPPPRPTQPGRKPRSALPLGRRHWTRRGAKS
ncbi:MAG: hypothetical protein ACRD0U_17505 [Acidimicrobiales bacterium]